MAKNDEITFIRVKDLNGDEFLCPINTVTDNSSKRVEVNDDCIEEDVVGRYAGNIDIKAS